VDCRSIQLVPTPDKQTLERAYEEDFATKSLMDPDPESDRAAILAPSKVLKDKIDSYLSSGKVLEIGPGWGLLGELLVAASYEYHCVEPSREMANYCRDRGLTVFHGDIHACDERDYDAIVMRGVFEHVLDYDAWLQRARRILSHDGLIISSQPTAPFAGLFAQLFRLGDRHRELPQLHKIFAPLWHNVLFSPEGMTTMMHRAGFELVEITASTQGRERGLTGIMQWTLENATRIGTAFFGMKWPLILSHVFVFKKREIESDVEGAPTASSNY